LLFLKVNLGPSVTISVKKFRRKFCIDFWKGYLVRNNEIYFSFPCFTFIPKTQVWDYLKQGFVSTVLQVINGREMLIQGQIRVFQAFSFFNLFIDSEIQSKDGRSRIHRFFNARTVSLFRCRGNTKHRNHPLFSTPKYRPFFIFLFVGHLLSFPEEDLYYKNVLTISILLYIII